VFSNALTPMWTTGLRDGRKRLVLLNGVDDTYLWRLNAQFIAKQELNFMVLEMNVMPWRWNY
jgi:hypothetical protein